MDTIEIPSAPTNDDSRSFATAPDYGNSSAYRAMEMKSDMVYRPAGRMLAESPHAVDGLARSASRAAETFDSRGEQVRAAQSRFAVSFLDYIRDQPFASLAIAIVTGILLNWLLRPR